MPFHPGMLGGQKWNPGVQEAAEAPICSWGAGSSGSAASEVEKQHC